MTRAAPPGRPWPRPARRRRGKRARRCCEMSVSEEVLGGPAGSSVWRGRVLVAGTSLRIILAPVVVGLLLGGNDTAAAIVFLRAAAAATGRHIEASLLGKWKATVQFAAIALAMLRPDVTIADAYLDQWTMALAALVTVWSGFDYLVRFSPTLRGSRKPLSR